MRREIYQRLGSEGKKKVPLLKGLDEETIGAIFCRLQMCVAADNTFLYHPREVGDEMFFIEQVSLNPKPETLNPKPETRNPKPETLNPEP